MSVVKFQKLVFVIVVCCVAQACATGPSPEYIAKRDSAYIDETIVTLSENAVEDAPGFDEKVKLQLEQAFADFEGGDRPLQILVDIRVVEYSGDGKKGFANSNLARGLYGYFDVIGVARYTFKDDQSLLSEVPFHISQTSTNSTFRALGRALSISAAGSKEEKEAFLAERLAITLRSNF